MEVEPGVLPVREPARVCEQHVERHLPPGERPEVGERGQRIVEGQAPAVGESKHARRRERLRDRAELKRRVGRQGSAGAVRPVRRIKLRRVAALDSHSAAKATARRELRQRRVEAVGLVHAIQATRDTMARAMADETQISLDEELAQIGAQLDWVRGYL